MGKKTNTETKAPKKKGFKWWILFIILALICGAIVFGVYRIKYMNVNYEKTISAPASFKKTSKKVIDVITAEQEEFSNATPEERKKIAEKIMDDLIEQGVLKEENIGFDEENNVYQFVTNDGALNLISLNDFDPEYMGAIDGKSDSGNGTEEAGSSEGKNTGNGEYQYFLNGYPYTEDELIAEDLDMLFLTNVFETSVNLDEFHHFIGNTISSIENGNFDQFMGNGAYNQYELYYNYHRFYVDHVFEICNQARAKYEDIPQTTVDELKTCLKGHDYVSMGFHGLLFETYKGMNSISPTLGFLSALIDAHAINRLENYLKDVYNEENTTFLLIPELVGIEADSRYAEDLVNGRVVRHLANFGYSYAITPLFFADYYDENDLKGTIVYLGACDGYKNETLPATLMSRGAKSVVGYNHPVDTNYGMRMEWRFLHWLMWGGTVEESVTFAKKMEGENDGSKQHSELKIYPKGKDAVLIKNAECTRKYVLIEESMSYEDAVKYCKDIGGKIASVQYPAEQRALKALLEKGEKNCYWIGLQKGDDGTLRWESDGSEKIYFLPWAANEPSGDGAHVVVYGRLDEKGRSKSGEWNDVTYDPNMHEGFYAAEQFGIVCELSGTDAGAVGIPEKTEIKENSEDYKVVTFGNYAGEDIEWIVLNNEENAILLISKDVLEVKEFNKIAYDMTWEESELRKWLNEDFYNSAFSVGEKERIKKTLVKTPDNPEVFYAKGGNDTEDYVFLLSRDEAYDLFESNDDRRASATEHAIQNGANPASNGYCSWWLRTRGTDNYRDGTAGFTWINHEGESELYEGLPVYIPVGVRPAIWINNEDFESGQNDEKSDIVSSISRNKPKWVCTKETSYEYDGYFTDGKFDYSWEYEYDAVGKLTKMTNYIVGWSNDIVSDHYHEYVYDTVGNMISDTDYFADGRWYYWTDYEYDSKGLMIKKIFNFHVNTNNGDPFGNDNRSSSEDYYEYDENGRLTKEIHYDSYNKLDDWSEKEYDIAGNLIKDAYYDGDGSLERYTTFEYDKQGSVVKEAYYNGDNNLSVSYVNEYDEQGNLIKSEHYDSDDVLFEIELYEFDSSGNKTMYSRCYADGSNPYREEYMYDAEGNNTKLFTYGSKGQLLKRYEYEYKYIPGDDE